MEYFTNNNLIPANLYYNLVDDSIYSMEPLCGLQNHFNPGLAETSPPILLRHSPNKGKDIGGKMVLLDAYLALKKYSDYGLFVHDKKSPYKTGNETWASNLLKISTNAFGQQAMAIFEQQPGVGIVTAVGNVRNEQDHRSGLFTSSNRTLLPALLDHYAINPSSYQYVAGTMFWFRMKPLQDFFGIHAPLLIRSTLEQGNVTDEVTGSNTHCWERLLSWIITSQHYSIKAI